MCPGSRGVQGRRVFGEGAVTGLSPRGIGMEEGDEEVRKAS